MTIALRDTVNRELGGTDVRVVLFTHLRLDWARTSRNCLAIATKGGIVLLDFAE